MAPALAPAGLCTQDSGLVPRGHPTFLGAAGEGCRPLGPGDSPQAFHLGHGPIRLSNSRLRSIGPCAWSCLGLQVRPAQTPRDRSL